MNLLQPHPLTSVMQMVITFCALCVAVAAIAFTVVTAREQRNAALVTIGVAVLRADPEKETQVRAAREWALDLIDANAGGVRFSKEARAELLNKALRYGTVSYYPDSTVNYYPDTYSSTPSGNPSGSPGRIEKVLPDRK